MNRTTFFIGVIILLFTMKGFSQDGSPDLSFGDNGIVITDIDGGSDSAFNIAKQSDGKIVIAGSAQIESENQALIVRFNLDGEIDATFGNSGISINSSYFRYNYIKIQNDDKILVGANYYEDGLYHFVLIRYLSDGSIDSSFAENGVLYPFLSGLSRGLVFQNENTFTITGTMVDNGVDVMALKRFFLDGSLDLSFGNNGIVTTNIGNDNNSIQNIELLNDGKIIVLAKISENNQPSHVLLKYLFDGDLDISYGNNGVSDLNLEPNFSANKIEVYEDDKVVVLASIWNQEEENRDIIIFRHLPNGNLDTSFANNGYKYFNGTSLIFNRMIVQNNQRLLVYGLYNNPFEGGGPIAILRYHLDGSTDESFNFFPISYEIFAGDMILQADGKILCVSTTPWYNGPEDIVLERYNNTLLSVDDVAFNNVSIYPNPSKDNFNISYEMIHSEINYQVTDVLGKVILTGQLDTLQTNINLSKVKYGMYFLNIQESTYRLLKE